MTDDIMPAEKVLLERFRKRVAREKVRSALLRGSLIKTVCAWHDCGAQNTEAHHPDYAFPLSVIWLCRKHHTRHHGALMRTDKAGAYREMFGLD